MPNMREACEEFRARQRAVYHADPDRIRRDVNSVREVSRDHIGRWPLELIQNSDDAEASEVVIRVADSAVYVADTGRGVLPAAVRSLSGTFLSVKESGIGRKGVGFKAVYEITSAPCILSGHGDGIVFSSERSLNWFREQGIPVGKAVPYQWLPFWASRQDMMQRDPVLQELASFATVIKLPLNPASGPDTLGIELYDIPGEILLTLRHIAQFKLEGDSKAFQVTVTPVGRRRDVCVLTDSRAAGGIAWRVERRWKSPPSNLLKVFEDEEERRRARRVSLVVASPVDEGGTPSQTEDPPTIYVYYPTEDVSPVSLLLHADFVVSSDRKRVISLEKNAFNRWVADNLAAATIGFVNRAYNRRHPSAHLRLLEPHEQLEEHPMAKSLWNCLVNQARKTLKLPDVRGKRTLRLGQARIPNVTIGTEHARHILESTPLARKLVHRQFDNDEEAVEALLALGCAEVGDDGLLNCIEGITSGANCDQELLWSCWQWLAEWASDEPYGEGHQKRVERIRALRILPMNDKVVSCDSVEDCIVTWRDERANADLPRWMPIRFLDDWFCSHISPLKPDAAVAKLMKDLHIAAPTPDVLARALGKAIELYWKRPRGRHSRFFQFLLEHHAEQWAGLQGNLRRCPIPARIAGRRGVKWVPAERAYFGQEWGNKHLQEVYKGGRGVMWAIPRSHPSKAQQKSLLSALGVAECPRVVPSDSEKLQLEEDRRISRGLPRHTHRDPTKEPLILDRLSLTKLSRSGATSLVALLALHWDDYYSSRTEIKLHYFYYTGYWHTVRALWWEQILEVFIPPQIGNLAPGTPLSQCWLPDKSVAQPVVDLLPVIDLRGFRKERPRIAEWLIAKAGLRQRLDQVSIDEWRAILEERIPRGVPEDEVGERNGRERVQRWYEAVLESLDAQDANEDVSRAPLLCRKSNALRYVGPEETRWLADDADLAEAFREDIHQIGLPEKFHTDARKYFKLESLSASTRVETHYDAVSRRGAGELRDSLELIKPYVFAWRCSRTKSEKPAKLREALRAYEVLIAENLYVVAALDKAGISRDVPRPFHYEDNRLLLNPSATSLTHLAAALASALGVRSEAHFYQNLLRCQTDAERDENLRMLGMLPEELERWRREYHASGMDLPEPDGPDVPKEHGRRSAKASPASGPSSENANEKQGESKPRSEGVEQPKGSSQPAREATQAGEERRNEIPLELKNPESCPFEMLTEKRDFRGRGTDRQSGPSGSVESGSSGEVLSDSQKKQIEQCGRRIVARILEEKPYNYTVESMPFENPGYDLRASKGQEVLFVEVKAHRGKSYIVDLTPSEYRLFAECRARKGGQRWELWNVEHLSANAPLPVQVVHYDTIPEEALDVRMFKVDLRRCGASATE